MKRIAIGNDDFKEIRQNNSLFIDKTDFIKDVIDNDSKVLLFPRPRRFGKSINLSMLKYYFDVELESQYLFDGLKIMNYGDKYIGEMNKYPVISLTLKEAKKGTYEEFIEYFKVIILNLYSNYKFLLESDNIEKYFKEYFIRCLEGTETSQLSLALSNLSNMLEKYYNEKVIILLDEYDAPILESFMNGYYSECIEFMRSMFSSTFKGNLSLKKGVITGILRVSKEGMFSGANNIKIYNVLDYDFREYFGFTEEEVKDLLNEYELSDNFEEIKKWYDGYNFCDTRIYNPWSILNYLVDSNHTFGIYWANTGGTDLLKHLIYETDDITDIFEEYQELIETNEVDNVNLDLEMDLTHLEYNRNTIWTLFMLAGYLTPKTVTLLNEGMILKIPNFEIRKNLEKICINWFNQNIKGGNRLVKYLYNHDMASFKEEFVDIVEKSFSYYDLNKKFGESFYHAFAMGILYNSIDIFEIKSNRESGLGRYDLILKSKKNNYAYIIEFKTARDCTVDEAIGLAFKQIEEKKYDVELTGFDITKIAVAFRRKEVKIEIR